MQNKAEYPVNKNTIPTSSNQIGWDFFVSMKNIYIITFILILFSFTFTYGQTDNQYQKDSLLKVIKSAQGEEKLQAYRTLCRLPFPDEELDLKLQYTNDFMREARKQQNKDQERFARRIELADLYNFRINEFEKKAKEHLIFFKDNNYPENYYYTFSLLLQYYGFSGDQKRRIEETKQMYAEATQQQSLYGIARAGMLMGQIYYTENRWEEAEKCYKDALEKAFEMLRKDPAQSENNVLVFDIYAGLTVLMKIQNRFDEAISLMSDWRKRLTDYEKLINHRYTALYIAYYGNYAMICIGMGEYDRAELYCDSIEQMNPEPIDLYELWINKSNIYLKRGEWDKAMELTDKLIEYDNETGDKNFVISLSRTKVYILDNMGRYKEALDLMYNTFNLNDSIRSIEINAQLDELRTQYEVDKHIAEKEKARLSFRFASGIGALLLIVLIIWIFYSRKIHRKNVAMVEQILAQEKDWVEIDKLRKIAQENAGTASETDEIFARLEKLMHEQQPYTETDCNRKTLTEAVGTNGKYLSESIKNNTGLSVSEYIMKYRLKHANSLLLRPVAEYTIDAVAFDSGFGSRSKFYEHYRANYGITPNEFRKTIQAKKE